MKKITQFFIFLMTMIAVNGQVQIAPIFSKSNQPPDSGKELSKALDNNINTIYQTKSNAVGIPDILDFYFTNIQNVIKIEYIPRTSGSGGIWTSIDIQYSTQSAPNTFITLQTGTVWANDTATKIIDLAASPINNPKIIRLKVNAGNGQLSSAAEIKFYSAAAANTNPVADCVLPTSEFDNLTDVKVLPISAVVTPAANSPAENADKSIDGSLSTIFHSQYSNTDPFPVSLTYTFTGNNSIDMVKYYTRTTGVNGNFGVGEVWFKQTPGSSPVKVADFDCGFVGPSHVINLSQQLTNVHQIIVKIMTGKNGFASCAEMEFYNTALGNIDLYPQMFNALHTELLPGVSQNDINSIVSPFFKSLAQCLYDSSYKLKFRKQEYLVYPTISQTTSKLKTMGANSCENPTGILFQANTTAIVFVGPTDGQAIYLQTRDFAGENTIAYQSYVLKPGINVIKILSNGLGYISFHRNFPTTAQPVAINITAGLVNGYYDPLTDTDFDWQADLTNNVYKKYDIKGTYINLNLDKPAVVKGSYLSGAQMIDMYDKIVKTEYELMGLFKFNKVPKNHMFLYTPIGGGLYASAFGAHMSIGTTSVLSVDDLLKDSWGESHELGHINQVRPNFKWHGMTEVTNNIYSAYIQYLYSTDYPNSTRFDKRSEGLAGYSPTIVGGQYNINIMGGHVKGESIYEILSQDNRVTTRAATIPLWQLMLYYSMSGALKGLPTLQERLNGTPAPVGQPDVAYWIADLLEICRTIPSSGTTAEHLLRFVSNTCDIVQEDLTDFFIKSGYLRPVNKSVADYSTQNVTITDTQIANTIASIKAKGYPQPVSPVINYLSTNSFQFAKQQLPVTGVATVGVIYTAGSHLTVNAASWKNVIAFETYNQNTLIDVAIFGTGYANLTNTKVSYPSNATSVYAVAFDGTRKLVYPASDPYLATLNNMITTKDSSDDILKIYPNPATDHLNLSGVKMDRNYEIYSISGQKIRTGISKNNKIDISELIAGKYLLKIENGSQAITFIKK